MARTKKSAVKADTNKPDLKSLVRKNEFIVGVGTIVILLLVGALALKNNTNLLNTAPNKEIKTTNTKIDSESATSSATQKKENVEMLSNTSSAAYALVLKGDSYFRITKRFCGTGDNYLVVSSINGNRDIHPGETIQVTCF